MNQVQPLIDLLAAKHGWVAAALVWMSAWRLAMKWFSEKLQGKLTERMAMAASDEEEGRDWELVLHARWYRILNFTLDLALSVKLPVYADFLKVKAAKESVLLKEPNR